MVNVPLKRRRNAIDKAMIRQEVAEFRMKGNSFDIIADKVGLSEKQVRRHYTAFLLVCSTKYRERQQEIFGEIAAQFETSLDQANIHLTKAIEGDNQAKIFLWHKMKQECLRDYHRFLKDVGFVIHWAEKPQKPDPIVSILAGRY